LTDVATNHLVTKQQSKDYKEQIIKSEDKVKSYNNKINKHMSSKKQVKVMNGKDLHTLPSTENSSVKTSLLISQQWTQVRAKEEKVHTVQTTADTIIMEWKENQGNYSTK
jgi:hypothetical protein